MQRAYDRALLRLRADLPVGLGRVPTVVVDLTDPENLPYSFIDGTCFHRSSLWWGEDEEEATVHLAFPLQDDILDWLWGPVWPPCRGHPHPAEAQIVAGKAVWVCPRTGETLAAIGSLS